MIEIPMKKTKQPISPTCKYQAARSSRGNRLRLM